MHHPGRGEQDCEVADGGGLVVGDSPQPPQTTGSDGHRSGHLSIGETALEQGLVSGDLRGSRSSSKASLEPRLLAAAEEPK